MTAKKYTEKELEELFQAGVNHGIMVGGMIMHGNDDSILPYIEQIWPGFHGSLNKIKDKLDDIKKD